MTTPDEIAHEIALDNEAIARCKQCVDRVEEFVEELKAQVDDLENVKKAESREMKRKSSKAAKVRAESWEMQMKDNERAEERSAMQREMQKKDEPKKDESTRSGLRKGFL
jgi:septal ring factor EnvC (AmiA/AmiB activator)